MGYSYEDVNRAEREILRDELKRAMRDHCDRACHLAAEIKYTGSAVFYDFDPNDLATSIVHLRSAAKSLMEFAAELEKLEMRMRSDLSDLRDLGIDFAAWAAGYPPR